MLKCVVPVFILDFSKHNILLVCSIIRGDVTDHAMTQVDT